jgi:hypothetical protein
MDAGLSELFSSRIQEAVFQPGNVNAQTSNPKKEPDRMHCLQRTVMFEKLLQELYSHEEPERST